MSKYIIWRSNEVHTFGESDITALDIARYVIAISNKENLKVNNITLQWLLFIINRRYKNKFGYYIFYDSLVKEQYYPKYESVYYEFCGFGALPIRLPLRNSDFIPIQKDVFEIVKSVVLADGNLNLYEMYQKYLAEYEEAEYDT